MPFHVQFFSYGKSRRPYPTNSDIIYRVDCSHLPPPPPHLCEVSTGLDFETAETFWAHNVNNERYLKAVAEIKPLLYLARDKKKESVTIAVFCMAGMHRSVAMAERLARHFVTFPGISVLKPKHLDLAAGVKRQQESLLKKEKVSRLTEEKEKREEKWRREGKGRKAGGKKDDGADNLEEKERREKWRKSEKRDRREEWEEKDKREKEKKGKLRKERDINDEYCDV